jgi:hypothetical protein
MDLAASCLRLMLVGMLWSKCHILLDKIPTGVDVTPIEPSRSHIGGTGHFHWIVERFQVLAVQTLGKNIRRAVEIGEGLAFVCDHR